MAYDRFESANGDPLELLWPEQRVGRGRERFTAPLVAEHGLLAACSTLGRVTILNRFTGEVMDAWTIGPGTEGEFSALFCGDWLVAGGDRAIGGISLARPFRSWEEAPFRLPAPDWVAALEEPVRWSLIACERGSSGGYILAVTSTASASRAYCLDVDSGEPIGPAKFIDLPSIGPPVWGGAGKAYALTSEGNVIRIDVESGKLVPSKHRIEEPDLNTAPVWQDENLFFFNLSGNLCACATREEAPGAPTRISELKLTSVSGFSVSPLGVLVGCATGMALLSRTGQRLWRSNHDIDACGAPPITMGSVGAGTATNQRAVYVCDLRGSSFRFRPRTLGPGTVAAPPACAEGVVYACSLDGDISAVRIAA
ncbi:MAG: hypothetical protein KIT09_00660 [Bryobacteraceae bacterium]|nr:hypothetical protein [Bryobacteraceae bacterium]